VNWHGLRDSFSVKVAIFTTTMKKDAPALRQSSGEFFSRWKRGELVRYPFTDYKTILTCFHLRIDPLPYMNTSFAAGATAPKEAATPIAFESLPACLTAYAVVVAYSFEMLTGAHVRN